MKDDSIIPLKYDKYKEKMDDRKAQSKQFENIGKQEIAGLYTYNLKADMDYINFDSSRIGPKWRISENHS